MTPGNLHTTLNAVAAASGTFLSADEFHPALEHRRSRISSAPDVPPGVDTRRAFPNCPQNLPGSTARQGPKTNIGEKEAALGDGYRLAPEDVLCLARGCQGSTSWHPGNERFRVLVVLKAERYKKATASHERARIGRELVQAVRQSGANFVRREGNAWYDIGNRKAREKARHALRAAASAQRLDKRVRRGRTNRSTGSRRTTNDKRSELFEHIMPPIQSSSDNVQKPPVSEPIKPRAISCSPEPKGLPAPEPITLAAISCSPEPEGFREFIESTFLMPERNTEHDNWMSAFEDHSGLGGSYDVGQDSSCDPVLFEE